MKGPRDDTAGALPGPEEFPCEFSDVEAIGTGVELSPKELYEDVAPTVGELYLLFVIGIEFAPNKAPTLPPSIRLGEKAMVDMMGLRGPKIIGLDVVETEEAEVVVDVVFVEIGVAFIALEPFPDASSLLCTAGSTCDGNT